MWTLNIVICRLNPALPQTLSLNLGNGLGREGMEMAMEVNGRRGEEEGREWNGIVVVVVVVIVVVVCVVVVCMLLLSVVSRRL